MRTDHVVVYGKMEEDIIVLSSGDESDSEEPFTSDDGEEKNNVARVSRYICPSNASIRLYMCGSGFISPSMSRPLCERTGYSDRMIQG